jgi:hypothetical protein
MGILQSQNQIFGRAVQNDGGVHSVWPYWRGRTALEIAKVTPNLQSSGEMG